VVFAERSVPSKLFLFWVATGIVSLCYRYRIGRGSRVHDAGASREAFQCDEKKTRSMTFGTPAALGVAPS
jgi:hypothetical protein